MTDHPSIIESVQWLRLLAATLVVFYHAEVQLFHLDEDHVSDFGLGASGVDLFFVISGFIMVLISRNRPTSFSSFIRRRLMRIVPLYWSLTLAVFLLVLLTPSLLRSASLDPLHVLSSFLFLPYPHPVLGQQMPLLVPGWTLNYEIAFYCLFGALLFLPLLGRIAVIGCIFTILVLMRTFLGDEEGIIDFYGSPMTYEFMLGMIVGWLYFRCATIAWEVLVGVIAISAIIIAAGIHLDIAEEDSRVVFWGIPAAGIVLVSVFVERMYGWPQEPLLRLLGDASYSIYLSHLFVLATVSAAIEWLDFFPVLGAIGSRGTFIATALAGGVGVYFCIERPAREWLGRLAFVRWRLVVTARTSAPKSPSSRR